MKILTDEINRKIQIHLDPSEYFLKKLEGKDRDWFGEYSLVAKIDMSYCGKPPQEGCPVIYLNEKQAEKLKGLVDEIL